AGSLESLLARNPRREVWPEDMEEDLQRGLSIITSRAEALTRFMSAYAQLAKLPPPNLKPLEISPWIHQVAALETRLPVDVLPGPEITIQADRDQLEQLLINLLRNAVDAARETSGGVLVRWNVSGNTLELTVEDEGPGLSNT